MEETLPGPASNKPKTLKPKKNICVAFLSPRWNQDHFGIATLTHLLVDNIRTVDDAGDFVKVYCLVAQRQEDIPLEDHEDAAKRGVMLIGAGILYGDKNTWNMDLEEAVDALNVFPGAYYHHITDIIPKVTQIVGHIPYLADGPMNIKEAFYRKCNPKVILVNHQAGHEIKDHWCENAEFIFSVGHMLYDETDRFLKGLGMDNHSLYLPGCSTDYLQTKWEPISRECTGHNILVLSSDTRTNKSYGKDLTLAVRIAAEVNELCVLANQRNRITLKLGNIPMNEWAVIENDIKSLIQKIGMKNSTLTVTNTIADTPEKLSRLFKTCSLYLLTLEAGSLIFDIEALKAANSGLPILVPKN